MISKSTGLPIVAFSVRAYEAFLLAYPTIFRQEYGSQMVQVFQDCCLRTVRQGGTNGMFRLWMITLLDLLQSVISEHRQKELEVKKEMKPEDIRMAGWALILGGIAFILGIFLPSIGASAILEFLLLIILSMPLLVVGLLAMRSRYGENAGGFGKNILLTGAILGPLITLLGIVIGIFTRDEQLWIAAFGGLAVLLACLALFGIIALYKKPLPRWNIVPVIAGVWYPILLLFAGITSGIINWEGLSSTSMLQSVASAPMFKTISVILLIIQGIALAALGYILKSDVPEEAVAPV